MQVFANHVCRMRFRAALLFATVWMFSAASGARAQEVAVAEVDGRVTDPSGASVSGATVRITDVDTRQTHAYTTDAAGVFRFPNLPVGAYTLEVSAQGFKAYRQTGITLEVAHNVEQNVALTLGATTDTVEVAANASMVETKENAISQLIGQQAIEDLPLNGRNPTQLFILSGATSNMTLNGGDLTGSKNIQGSNGSGQFSVAGAQANGINFLLDGGDNNDAFSNVGMPIPFPDAIQEFNVQFEGLPAQYGLHPGGVVNVVTRSGANALHGDLFDYLRNGDLNARPEGYGFPGYSVNSQSVRDSLKRNQFGGTVGGRIKKDKLFFYAGYQGTRQRSDPANNTAYVPTAAALQGDFSVLDGATSSGGCLSKARALKDPKGVPYPGDQIPLTSFDQAGFKLATSFLPLANNPCGTDLFGYLTNNPDDQIIGRVDWLVSDKHTFYGRYYIYDYTALSLFDGKNALTTGTPGNQDRTQTITIGDNYTFAGGSRVNAFHATFMRRRDNRASALNMFSPKDVGVNMFINISDYTQLSVSNYSGGGFNIGCGTCALANFDINTYQLSDDFTWIKGAHQLAFGFDGRKIQFNSFNYQQANGQFTFNGSTTGDGLADLLIGRFSGLTDGNVISDYLRQTVIAAYAQDSFHVARTFTVNLGVRWEPWDPTYDKYGRGNQFSWPLFQQGWHSSEYPTAPAGLIFSKDTAQDPYGSKFTASHWALFSPRLGLVWDPRGDGKQTIRAAFNLMHDTPEMFYPERWTTNAPYVSSISLTSGQFSNPFGAYTLNGVTGDPFPGATVFPAQGAYVTIPQHIRPQYMMQWNISYQRQLARDLLVTVNYMGNATRHIWGSTDLNYAVGTIAGASTSNTNNRRLTYLASPTLGQYYADIQQTDDGANAEYHGLFLTLQKRMSHNFSSQANYTWSHCISSWDFAGELAGTVYQNPTNRATGERGNCGFDHRQSLNFSVSALSTGVGSSAARAVTGGWQVSTLVGFGTGNPIQLSDGGKDISLSGQGLDRPEVIAPSQVYPSQKSLAEYFNPAAFQCNTPTGSCTTFSGLYGNLGRNAVYGPGYINFDVALSRQFRMGERWKLNLRADMFNILNHANWGNPGANITTSSTFGVISSFGAPRIVQMAAKVFF
jgi:hypothetical protein